MAAGRASVGAFRPQQRDRSRGTGESISLGRSEALADVFLR